ncbi:Transportin-3 [Lamellibrachia satsuma]|nr:Transportin-3 [Lamellibrachia satsuma]
MDSAPSLETVLVALNALYRNPDIAGKEKASVWLGELQKSVYAWQISDQLLQLNQDIESCYFAAQTMRTKIQYAFHELPATSHQSLRDSLLNHATKISEETPPVIETQLCLAVADLSLQMATWKDPVPELIQKFGQNPQQWNFLLELLTVLPEEINSRSLRLGANRRAEITEELVKASPMMVQLLIAVLETKRDDMRIGAKVFRCLSSWLSAYAIPQDIIIGTPFAAPLSHVAGSVASHPQNPLLSLHSSKSCSWLSAYAIPQDIIIGTPLVAALFQVMMDRESPSHVHEAVTDCLCSALYIVEDLEKNAALAQALFQGVMALPDAYHLSVAYEDMDKTVNYCRIFTEMAESFLEVIVNSPNTGFGDLRTLELLLMCVGHHQYEVADITFNFWYRLSEALYQRNTQPLNEIFKPYIQRLIVALCRQCQFDSDHEGIADSTDEFVDFRSRVSELIKDVVFITDSSCCFTQMFENLKNQSVDASWDTSEAALFIMCAVAKNILPDDNEIVPQVLNAVLQMPDTIHIALRYTSILLVGELSDWIEKHPEFLDQQIARGQSRFRPGRTITEQLDNLIDDIESREQEGRVYLLNSKISCGVPVQRTGGLSLPAAVLKLGQLRSPHFACVFRKRH